MTETVIFSCHAESTGKTFKLQRDITFYCVQGDSLANKTAYVLLGKLRYLDGQCQNIPGFWKSEVEKQDQEQLVDFYSSGDSIPDYNVWDLEYEWRNDTGLFAFSKGTPLLEALGEGKLLSDILTQNPEITTVFWLACNA